MSTVSEDLTPLALVFEDDGLVPNNPLLKPLKPVAVAWVDCDLYESTQPVLEFLTGRLQDGSLIFFDLRNLAAYFSCSN